MEPLQAGSSTPSHPNPSILPSHHVARGFAQTFSLHPGVALLTVMVDSMLFTGEVVTLGMGLPFSFAVSAAVGFLAYRAQQKWHHDDKESAAIKGGILALLVAIPSPIPSGIYLSAGVIGLFRRNKN